MAQREHIATGRTWGRLTYTGRSMNRPPCGRFIECLCVCGHLGWHRLSSIKDGRITSCGCARRDRWLKQVKRTGSRSPFWRGAGRIGASIWRDYATSARTRHLAFTVTLDYVWALFIEQQGRCALSGIRLTFATSRRTYASKTASLDRINPRRGYVPGNVQWVHKRINVMKSTMTTSEFRRWCRLVAERKDNR